MSEKLLDDWENCEKAKLPLPLKEKMSTGAILGAKKKKITNIRESICQHQRIRRWLARNFHFSREIHYQTYLFFSTVTGLIMSRGSRCQTLSLHAAYEIVSHSLHRNNTGRQSRTIHHRVSETLGKHIEIIVINYLRVKNSCNLFKWTDVSTALCLLLCLMQLGVFIIIVRGH